MLRRLCVVLGVVTMLSGSAWAGFFQAAELVFVPAVAHNEGTAGSVWRSDLTITNVDSVPVDVAIFFLPSGLGDNSYYVATRDYALGGREDEGWGHLNEALADIPPGGSVVLEDVVGTYWSGQLGMAASLGALMIFGYESGTADADDGPVYRNIVANARTYNVTTIWKPDPESEDPENPDYVEEEVSYGQTIPGIPWYSMADPNATSDQGDFTYLVLSGGADSDVLRYNVGLLNASDKQTAITLQMTPYDSTGAQFVDADGNPISRRVTLGALGHFQVNRVFRNWFGIGDDVSGAMVKVEFLSWQTTNPTPVPLFTCYGSYIDGRSNDPTTVLPSFGFPFNVQCMFPSNPPDDGGGDDGGSKAFHDVRREGVWRPLSLPRR